MDTEHKIMELEQKIRELQRNVRGDFSLGVKPLRDEFEALNRNYERLQWGVVALFVIDAVQLVVFVAVLVVR